MSLRIITILKRLSVDIEQLSEQFIGNDEIQRELKMYSHPHFLSSHNGKRYYSQRQELFQIVLSESAFEILLVGLDKLSRNGPINFCLFDVEVVPSKHFPENDRDIIVVIDKEMWEIPFGIGFEKIQAIFPKPILITRKMESIFIIHAPECSEKELSVLHFHLSNIEVGDQSHRPFANNVFYGEYVEKANFNHSQ